VEQKRIETEALKMEVKSLEKDLRQAKDMQRETLERKQKLDTRASKKQEKAGLPRIAMNTFRNKAEKSTSNLKSVHEAKTALIAQALTNLRKATTDISQMKFNFQSSALHDGKTMVEGSEINYRFRDHNLWKESLSFKITSGDRIALTGKNGSGKTILIKLILGQVQPSTGNIRRAPVETIYIDQDYALIDNSITVLEQAQRFNRTGLEEHDVKARLNRFLFSKEYWDRSCATLSGGEKMRLILCSLNIGIQAPDMIILDEPVNNLDIRNISILTAAVNEYDGTLIVVSHDETFLKEVRAQTQINLG